MRYLLSGGAGFIGSHITEELAAKGEEIIILDDFSTGKEENLKPTMRQAKTKKAKISIVRVDVRDASAVEKIVTKTKPDYIIHLAAKISVQESMEKPEEYQDVNVNGTKNVLEAARRAKVKGFVFASSAAVYGDDPRIPQKEKQKARPLSNYAKNKLEGEILCKEYYQKQGVPTIALRFFNVFGPRQDPNSSYAGVIVKFAKNAIAKKESIIFGDGEQTRDFIYVKDIAKACILACKAKKGFGEAYNIGTGKKISVNLLSETINSIAGESKPARHTNAQANEVRNSCADISLAKKVLGFTPKTSFEEGLKETIEWIKKSQ